MKRVNIFFGVIILLAVIVSSCSDYKEKSVSLKSDVDSLNYAFGYVNGKILKDYHLKEDSTGDGFKALMKGIEEGMKSTGDDNDSTKAVVDLGTMIGNQLRTTEDFYGDSTLTIDMKLLKQGLINGIAEFEGKMSPDTAMNYFNATMQRIQQQKIESSYKGNKDKGVAFLAENAKKEGVMTTASGLQYEVINAGKVKGPKPVETDRVKVHYHGTLIDGTVFDSSVDRGTPAEFGVTQVIRGWVEGLQLMPVGAKYKFYIPQELAYGPQNQGSIQPFSALVFEVELLEILK
jgi:FKBP-type peptidyl-prolyl cis-trans isomerase FkpA